MKLKSFRRSDYVFKYLDHGNTFFIILKGSVDVRVPTTNTYNFTKKELYHWIKENKDYLVPELFTKNFNNSNFAEIFRNIEEGRGT